MKRIDEDVREYQKKWMQLLEIRDIDRVPKIIMEYKSVVLRDLGRPTGRWKDQF
jgi:hypothetical protein